ncbi:AAA ATPase [Kappamyces sp. JEL0680]|nr:AAA ATPase [Kappamyces sp. JEL0680]
MKTRRGTVVGTLKESKRVLNESNLRPVKRLKKAQDKPTPRKDPTGTSDGQDPSHEELTATPTKVSATFDAIQSDAASTTPANRASKREPKTPLAKILADAKQVFRRCSTPKKLVGREHERTVITDFVSKALGVAPATSPQGGSLYISGCPGTGKTALVSEVLDTLHTQTTPKTRFTRAVINCMTANPKVIYARTLEQLGLDVSGPLDPEATLMEVFCKGKGKDGMMYVPAGLTRSVLVLDEIDHLITRDQNVLYNFFEWAKLPSSRLVLVGIANALDLTHRFLPRLKTKNSTVEPQYLSFAPYKVEEISAIIKDRLQGLDPGTPLTPVATAGETAKPGDLDTPTKKSGCLMQPMAIELTARKLAGTGDLRKALDVCRYWPCDNRRHAISMVEADPAHPQVTVKHILKATATLFGNSSRQRIVTMTMQPKLVLYILSALQTSSKAKEYMLQELYARYKNVASKRSGIDCVGSSDFQDLIGQLQDAGLIHVAVSKKGADKKVSLSVSVDDILGGIKGTSAVLDKLIEDGLKL